MRALLIALLLHGSAPVVECRAVDGLGLTLAEAREPNGLACRQAIKALLERRCLAGVESFPYRYEASGSRPAYLVLTCRPRK